MLGSDSDVTQQLTPRHFRPNSPSFVPPQSAASGAQNGPIASRPDSLQQAARGARRERALGGARASQTAQAHRLRAPTINDLEHLRLAGSFRSQMRADLGKFRSRFANRQTVAQGRLLGRPHNRSRSKQQPERGPTSAKTDKTGR